MLKIMLEYLIFLATLTNIRCLFGVFVTKQNCTYATIKCMFDNQFPKGIQLAISSSFGINSTINDNLRHMKNVGMTTQIIFVPCRGTNPTEEVKQFLSRVQDNLYDRVWLIGNQQSKEQICKWKPDNTEQNVRVLVMIVNQFFKNNKNVGIIANEYYWDQMFGGTSLFNDLDLFWNSQTVDTKQSFDGYKKFGGWEKPFQKFSKNITLCGVDVGTSYYS